ncbi:MAG: amidase, partial [Mycobacterium sp.]
MSALADQTRWMDAIDQAALVASGEVSPSELLEAAIERIERIDPTLNAVVIRWFDHAREIAASPDLPNGPFRGVPFLIKDLFADYAGQRISNGNVALKEAHFIGDADTRLVSRYRAAGLVIAGRTNSPELGSVPTTEPVAWGATHNPWDTTRTPGGSSGGAAAAVASGMVPFAHASDGGGSIRIPASCCGLVGLKPSQGRITLGPVRDESGLAVEHCVSRTVRDSAALLDATRGPGIGDTVIAPPPTRLYVEELGADPGRLRIGILDHHAQGGRVDAEVTEATRAVGKLLESLGHHVEAAWPKALEDETIGSKFGAMWSANVGISQRRFSEQLGRPLEDGELEPMNRVQADYAKHFSAID